MKPAPYKTLKPKAGKKQIVEGSLVASMLGADAYIGLGTKKLSWLNSVRYKTNSYLLGSMETKGEYKPKYLDYQTYLSYTPNKRWKLDLIGYISDNHYDFEPENRETTFGTMENVKSFKVYFDGHEKRPLHYLLRNSWHHAQLRYEDQPVADRKCLLYQGTGEIRHSEPVLARPDRDESENLGVGTYFEHARNYLTARVLSAKLDVQTQGAAPRDGSSLHL